MEMFATIATGMLFIAMTLPIIVSALWVLVQMVIEIYDGIQDWRKGRWY